MPPPPPQQWMLGRSDDGWITLCYVVRRVLLVSLITGFVAVIAWLIMPARGAHFTVTSLSISGRHVAFNVSISNPNRYLGISYKGAPRASLFSDNGRAVASGPAFADTGDWWYQPSMATTTLAGAIDIVDERSFSTTLRAGRGRLPLLLQFNTPIRLTFLYFFPPVELNMGVDCDLLVGVDGSLLRESMGAPCDTYFVVPLLRVQAKITDV